jgi:hypothetical protein
VNRHIRSAPITRERTRIQLVTAHSRTFLGPSGLDILINQPAPPPPAAAAGRRPTFYSNFDWLDFGLIFEYINVVQIIHITPLRTTTWSAIGKLLFFQTASWARPEGHFP